MSTNRDDFGIAIRSALLQRGARQKFSLFFLICLSVLIFFLDSYPNKYMDKTRSLLNDGIYRVSSVATSPFKFFSYISLNTKNHFFVYKENQFLKKELELFKSKEFKMEFLLTENNSLREELKSNTKKSYTNLLARVMIDKESPFLKSIIINKGSRSKILKGMPVLDGDYLIGRIVEVNYISSRVLLLNDLNSRIPVLINKSGAQAILTGRSADNPELKYLPEDYESAPGNVVYTSGKDGVFSEGLIVGTTIIVDGKVLVKLSADPNQLSYVNIILSKDIKEKIF